MSENQKIIDLMKGESYSIKYRLNELERLPNSEKSEIEDFEVFTYIHKCRTFDFICSMAISDRYELGISAKEIPNPFPNDSTFGQWYEIAWKHATKDLFRKEKLPF